MVGPVQVRASPVAYVVRIDTKMIARGRHREHVNCVVLENIATVDTPRASRVRLVSTELHP